MCVVVFVCSCVKCVHHPQSLLHPLAPTSPRPLPPTPSPTVGATTHPSCSPPSPPGKICESLTHLFIGYTLSYSPVSHFILCMFYLTRKAVEIFFPKDTWPRKQHTVKCRKLHVFCLVFTKSVFMVTMNTSWKFRQRRRNNR